MKESRGKRRQFFKVFLTLAACFGLLILIGLRAYTKWVQPPEVEPEAPPKPVSTAAPGQTEQAEPEEIEAERTGEVYTILLVGNDDGRGNTDTILVGKIDTGAHTMDFVSIPRDTLVNLPWDIRKINAVYAGWTNSGHVGIEGLKKHIRNLTGFMVDCYAVIDLDVFVDAIDLMGGVDFDVPRDMDYDDPNQDLHIHLKAGPQHLDGRQAMGVVRFRSGYANGDLGRVEMQQTFLRAVAAQFIKLGNIPHLPELVGMLAENMDTDLSSGNIAFFIQEALRCDAEDIRFHTMPNIPATVAGLSYEYVDLQPWLEMINAVLNPYDEPITADNLDVIYLSNGIRSTTGIVQDPAYYSRKSIFEDEEEPVVVDDPTPAPEETPGEPTPAPSEAPATPLPAETPPAETPPAETPPAETPPPETQPPESGGDEETIIIG